MSSKRKLIETIEMTGKHPPFDFELLDEFVSQCTVVDMHNSISIKLLFIAFQAYCIVRNAQMITPASEFRRKVKLELGWTAVDKMPSDLMNLQIVWKNIEIGTTVKNKNQS